MHSRLRPATRDFHALEFTLVIFIAFGYSILSGLVGILTYRSDKVIVAFDDNHLWSVVASELIFGPVIAAILWMQRWRWADFEVNYSNRGTLESIGIAVVTIALWWIARAALGALDTFSAAQITPPSASWMAVTAVSIVNPFFEELLVCGYVVQALRKRFGLAIAVNASIAIRMTYHLYQGPVAFVSFALMGLLFTIFYVRTGRLWPLILAHVLLDFIALAGL
jgi:uncharacterized protein